MEADAESPQAAFSQFVRRAVTEARDQRGWTVTDLAAHTGVGRSTVFRWLAGDWHDYPELAKVRRFCEALDVPVTAAFWALGIPGPELDHPHRTSDRVTVEADLRAILARLADPAVPAEEKKLIRDTLHQLASPPGADRSAGPPSA
ncbi:hypothetical protein GCM10027290_59510 [Micromonospora sonneratiae]|uniref:Helix-turn-helix domain-containing protein n=1 Tax=Micromonospora sonneratiae TaxID=1184706 RepID=A0ABW3Y9C9_9ACTN